MSETRRARLYAPDGHQLALRPSRQIVYKEVFLLCSAKGCGVWSTHELRHDTGWLVCPNCKELYNVDRLLRP